MRKSEETATGDSGLGAPAPGEFPDAAGCPKRDTFGDVPPGDAVMGFIVRMYDSDSDRMLLAARARSAGAALDLLRQWRTEQPGTWISIQPRPLPHVPEAA